jgi:hypothetical protein
VAESQKPDFVVPEEANLLLENTPGRLDNMRSSSVFPASHLAVCSAAMEMNFVKRTFIGNDFTATGH